FLRQLGDQLQHSIDIWPARVWIRSPPDSAAPTGNEAISPHLEPIIHCWFGAARNNTSPPKQALPATGITMSGGQFLMVDEAQPSCDTPVSLLPWGWMNS